MASAGAGAESASSGSTYAHQSALPSLPVPPLQQSLAKYLRSVQPFQTPAEHARTKALVADFGKPGGVGEKLQAALEERGRTHRNWLADWWDQLAYLQWGEPMPPQEGMTYKDDPLGRSLTQVQRAASVLQGVLNFHRMCATGTLPVVMARGTKTCMSQYTRLLSGVRIPGDKEDHHEFGKDVRHVAIACAGSWYTLEVLDADMRIIPDDVLEAHLEWIIADAKVAAKAYVGPRTSAGGARPDYMLPDDPDAAPSPGLFTTLERRDWAQVRKRLVAAGSDNAASLKAIGDALLVLSLPVVEALPTTNGVTRSVTSGVQGCESRFFDKSYQICVFPDGRTGGTLEHGVADGAPMVALAEYMVQFVKLSGSTSDDLPVSPKRFGTRPVPGAPAPPAESSTPADTGGGGGGAMSRATFLGLGDRAFFTAPSRLPRRLAWTLTPDLLDDLSRARRGLQRRDEEYDLEFLEFVRFGKGLLKHGKFSPDAFAQMALQVAQYRTFGRFVGTYESVGTIRFFRGRTETTRSVSNESVAFVKALVARDPTAWDEPYRAKLRALLDAACVAHVKYSTEAQMGQGIDRHLLGLRVLSAGAGLDLHAMFKEPIFGFTSTWRLSTSHLPAENSGTQVSFRAVERDGVGVWYTVYENRMSFTVATDGRCAETDATTFKRNIEQALLDMRALCAVPPSEQPAARL